jgi:type II secretory pathway pseudopilin PulG
MLAILAAVAIPKLFKITVEPEKSSVASTVSDLRSALSTYTARQFVNGQSIAVHNPFNDLSDIPSSYIGTNDRVTTANIPDGTWAWIPSRNWIVYNPESSINGGWDNGGEDFIIYEVQAVVDGADTIGLRLTTTDVYEYAWN